MRANFKTGTCSKNADGLLKNLYIAAPCPVKWESMQGDDRIRMCGGCSKNVYNLSSMSTREAESFLQENGVSECMIFFRRTDGTIITDNCPVGLRKLRDKYRKVAGLVAAFLAMVLSAPMALAQRGPQLKQERPPAPPGKHWSPNPAGGGMILVDDGPHVVMPVRPGRVAAYPNPNPPQTQPVVPLQKPPGHTGHPVAIQVKNYPSSSKKVTPAVKPGAERTDKQAATFFEKGQAAERNGETKLAEFFYEKSLDFFDAQPHGDKQFRVLINSRLQSVRKQLQNNTN